jgi:hypothetical protein
MVYKDLLKQGWNYLGIVSEKGLTNSLRKTLNQEFLQVLYEENHEFEHLTKEKFYDILVKEWNKVPQERNPGDGFIIVGRRRINEPVDESYLNNLKRTLNHGENKLRIDFVVMSGPGFQLSKKYNYQYIRDPTIDKVVWARW